MNDLLEPILRDTFEKRADQLDPGVRRRLMAVDYRPRARWRIPVLPALGLAGVAAAAIALALVFTLGSTPSPAFAGWSPTPTMARPGQTAAAIRRCRMGGRPVLVDTRGPFTAALFAHPKPEPPSGQPVVTSNPPMPPVKYTVGSCFQGPDVGFSSAAESGPPRVHTGQIQVSEQTVSGGSKEATLLEGRVGHGVSGVRIDLSNGRRVTATVSHGWYLVWWPGRPHGTAVEITAQRRSRTFRLPASASVGAGSCGADLGCASAGPVLTVGR